MKRLLLIAVTALMLSACSTDDVTIRTQSGAVNVGEVTSEAVRVKVIGGANGKEYDLGEHRISAVIPLLQNAWTGVSDTDILEADLYLETQTMVHYVGTKNEVDRLIDTTKIVCPKGFMFGTCMSHIDMAMARSLALYKEKFSYLK